MKDRHKSKILRYTVDDNAGKLKRLVKKHKLNLMSLSLEQGNTLLHIACQYESECILRYCLRYGLDPMLENDSGQLPLHIACQQASKHPTNHVYLDLVLPLIRASHKKSLDQRDNFGMTPRESLRDFKPRVDTDAWDDSDSSESASSLESDDSHSSDEWKEKLSGAFQEEEQDHWGRYENTEYTHEEAEPHHDDWFSKVQHDRHKKHQQQKRTFFASCASSPKASSSYPSTSHATHRGQGSNPKRQKSGVSEEQKRRFEENLKREYEEERKQRQMNSEKKAKASREDYENHCQEVFSQSVDKSTATLNLDTDIGSSNTATTTSNTATGASNTTTSTTSSNTATDTSNTATKSSKSNIDTKSSKSNTATASNATGSSKTVQAEDILSYRAIPWPHNRGGEVKDVEEFLFGGLAKDSDEYKKCLKEQRIRWHPDRFVQKVGQRLKESDRERIMEKVNQISQLLNSLS